MASQFVSKRPRGGSGDGDDDQAVEMLKSVEEFQKIAQPEIKDLSSLLINFIKYSVDNKRLDKLEENVNDLETEVHNLKLETANNKTSIEELEKKFTEKIEKLTESVEKWKKMYEELEAKYDMSTTSNNILLQNMIDNDVIVRGFPEKPDSKTVCDNFLRYFGLADTAVRYHYYFSYTSQFSGKTSHNVIVGFKEKEIKMGVIMRKKEVGSLSLLRIQPNLCAGESDVTLKFSNRLSKFNLYASYHLNKAKSAGQIHSIRYHNLCFSIKEGDKTQWQRISNDSELKKYVSLSDD
jgi:hypothetical protein